MAKRFSYYYLQVNTGRAWETLEQSETVAVLTSGLADQLASPTDAEIRIVGANFDDVSERWAYEQLFYIDQSSIDLGIADDFEDETSGTMAVPAFDPTPDAAPNSWDREEPEEHDAPEPAREPGPAISALLQEREGTAEPSLPDEENTLADRVEEDGPTPPWINTPTDRDEDSNAPPWGGFDDPEPDDAKDEDPTVEETVPWLRAQAAATDTSLDDEPEPFRFDTTPPPPRRRLSIGKIIGFVLVVLFLAAWVVIGALIYLQHPLILEPASKLGVDSYLRLGSHDDGSRMVQLDDKTGANPASRSQVEPLTTGQVVRYAGVAPALRGRWSPKKCESTFIEFDEDGYNRSINGQAAAEKVEITETLQDDFVYYLRRSPEMVEHFRKVTDNDIQLAGATTESGYLGSSGNVEIYSRCP